MINISKVASPSSQGIRTSDMGALEIIFSSASGSCLQYQNYYYALKLEKNYYWRYYYTLRAGVYSLAHVNLLCIYTTNQYLTSKQQLDQAV